jgi:hypothetical protein
MMSSRAPGGHRGLHAHRLARVLRDGTFVFCRRFLLENRWEASLLLEAASDASLHLAEGRGDSTAPYELKMKRIEGARASLWCLLTRYRDYLRCHELPLWHKDDPRCLEIRDLAFETHETDAESDDRWHHRRRYRRGLGYELYAPWFEGSAAESAANTAVCLVFQTFYLLNRHCQRLEWHHEQERVPTLHRGPGGHPSGFPHQVRHTSLG